MSSSFTARVVWQGAHERRELWRSVFQVFAERGYLPVSPDGVGTMYVGTGEPTMLDRPLEPQDIGEANALVGFWPTRPGLDEIWVQPIENELRPSEIEAVQLDTFARRSRPEDATSLLEAVRAYLHLLDTARLGVGIAGCFWHTAEADDDWPHLERWQSVLRGEGLGDHRPLVADLLVASPAFVREYARTSGCRERGSYGRWGICVSDYVLLPDEREFAW